MKINPYQTFTPMPGRASIEPSTDVWTDKQTVWTSPETQAFEANEGEFISGISLEQKVEKVSERVVNAEFIRQRDVNFGWKASSKVKHWWLSTSTASKSPLQCQDLPMRTVS